MTRRNDYGPLGELMDEIAYPKARVRGPYNVANYIREVAGEGPCGSSFSVYYSGLSDPSRKTMRLFRKVFECTPQQSAALAWTRAYGEPPPDHNSL